MEQQRREKYPNKLALVVYGKILVGKKNPSLFITLNQEEKTVLVQGGLGTVSIKGAIGRGYRRLSRPVQGFFWSTERDSLTRRATGAAPSCLHHRFMYGLCTDVCAEGGRALRATGFRTLARD